MSPDTNTIPKTCPICWEAFIATEHTGAFQATRATSSPDRPHRTGDGRGDGGRPMTDPALVTPVRPASVADLLALVGAELGPTAVRAAC
jgi:hypothetical protein